MNHLFTCSFCGATELGAIKIVAKGGKDEPAICSECVVTCVEKMILTKKSEAEKPTSDNEIISVDKKLFKELLQLVINLPDFGSKLAAVDIDSSSTSTSETFVRLEPSDFLLRLSAALRACG